MDTMGVVLCQHKTGGGQVGDSLIFSVPLRIKNPSGVRRRARPVLCCQPPPPALITVGKQWWQCCTCFCVHCDWGKILVVDKRNFALFCRKLGIHLGHANCYHKSNRGKLQLRTWSNWNRNTFLSEIEMLFSMKFQLCCSHNSIHVTTFSADDHFYFAANWFSFVSCLTTVLLCKSNIPPPHESTIQEHSLTLSNLFCIPNPRSIPPHKSPHFVPGKKRTRNWQSSCFRERHFASTQSTIVALFCQHDFSFRSICCFWMSRRVKIWARIWNRFKVVL